ncbi:DUF3108 domain-containing protein [Winogradskyella sp. UBA3174]|uniref:DUF3108 domain-containing protein n=1 Tax=Winogradskyella sp. UBA3174 TaxID=1947785 RepID=UPI0025D81FBA|nr:DUF3108 domain-containing protein [Winogradskyella sp. UBA3174]|tara:strand:+ start:51121 stop:51900 length:780 start_codon:yes stop_codon:yes gene_type:complete
MKHFIFACLALISLNNFAQNKTIATGEKLIFTAAYNMSGLLTDIAQVKMETSEVKTSKSTLLRLKCTATTYKKWDNFFKIRDLYESYVNPKTLTPYLYKRDINEGGYYKFMQYKFNHKSNTVKSLKRKKRKDGETWDENKVVNIGASTKDFVSTLYHIRNLDIHKASPGDQQSFKVLFDNKETTIVLKYIGKETISTKIGRKECYKLAISIKGSDVLKGKNDNLLWLTADANKVPVYVKFKIPVGNGELKIESATGLKN